MYIVGIYCRLSNEDRTKKSDYESQSIDNQKRMLTKYVNDKGWIIYRIYVDDGFTGLNFDRPAFNDMLKDIEDGKISIVVTKDMSRLGRDYIDVGHYMERYFPEKNIRYISVEDNIDTISRTNSDIAPFKAVINDMYSKDISKKIRSVLKTKQEAGEFIGSFAPYGYKKDPENNNVLIIDEKAAQVVKMIYDLYLQGNGTQHIARILNEKQFPNPTKYKQIIGLKYVNASAQNDHGFWNKTTVKRILKDQVYIGNMVQNKRQKVNYKSRKVRNNQAEDWTVVKQTHEPVVYKKTFLDVQNRIMSKVKSTGSGKAHIFASKVKCADCGNTMSKVRTGKYTYLRCKLYAMNRELCSSHSIRFDYLEDVISEKVRQYINMYCDEKVIAENLSKDVDYKNKITYLKDDLHQVEKGIQQKEGLLKNLYIDKVNEIISEEQFTQLNKTFTDEKDKLVTRKKKTEYELDRLLVDLNSINKWVRVVKEYKDFEKLTHIMVNELIDYIEVWEKDEETKEQKIEIHWNF